MQESMLSYKNWVIVGATHNPKKFGFKIFKFMKEHDYQVSPVNPGVQEILGVQCYETVRDLPTVPDVADFVIPAEIGEKVVQECAEIGIKNIWLQPGAESERLIQLAQRLGLHIVHHACVMEAIRKRGGK